MDDPPVKEIIEEDPSDNKFLAVALKGMADYIITGDSHLLKLKVYEGAEIITPRRFCEATGY